jgi:LysM repeat protein
MVRTYGAPAAFLLAVTIAVLAVHYAVQHHPAARTDNATRVVHVQAVRRHHVQAHLSRYVYVQRGDSLFAIAIRTRLTVAELESLNPGVSPTALRVGQRIRVK